MAEPSSTAQFDRRALASLLAFWADAGVDACVQDEPVDRLAEGARRLQSRPASTPPRRPEPVEPSPPERSDLASAVAAARQAATTSPDLAALEAAIRAFEDCPLRGQGARQAVFARGDPHAPVMIVGEAPCADEDISGQPFVGPAGQLLDRMLAAAGLSQRVFMTNTVFWRPPGDRTPTSQEQAICLPFLERAIALVRPRVLLLCGGVSTKALLKRDEGILSLRGRWLDWTSSDGELTTRALPTLHPAFLLRQPAAKKTAWTDLLTVLSRLDHGL